MRWPVNELQFAGIVRDAFSLEFNRYPLAFPQITGYNIIVARLLTRWLAPFSACRHRDLHVLSSFVSSSQTGSFPPGKEHPTSMNIDTLTSQLLTTHQNLSYQQRLAFFNRLAQLIQGKSSSSPSGEHTLPGLLLSDVPSHAVQWLWQDRLPLGHLTLLEGDSGIGTSLFALTLAAAISSGSPILNGSSGQQGYVLLITPGLHHASLLRQRLETAGADLSRITLLSNVEQLDPQQAAITDTPFSLPMHLPILEELITSLSPLLVIIDPLSLVVRNTRTLPDILSRLSALAERANCALLLVRHLPASRTSALTAHASSILRLSPVPGNDCQRRISTHKHTLAPAPPDLLLQIDEPVPGIPAFQFLDEASPAPTDSAEISRQRQAILRALDASPGLLSPLQLAEQTGLPYDPLRLLLSRMATAGEILRPARGHYSSLRPRHIPSAQLPPAETPPSPDTSDTFDAPGIISAANPTDTGDASAPSGFATIPDTSDTSDPTSATGTFDPTYPNGATNHPYTIDTTETYIFVHQFPPAQPGPHSPYPPNLTGAS